MATSKDDTTKLNLRMPPSLYRKVERDAEKRGLSMNAAIISRLEGAFHREQQLSEFMTTVLGGEGAAGIFRVLAALTVRGGYPEDWPSDYAQYNEVIADWIDVLRTRLAPPVPEEMQEKMNRLRETLTKGTDKSIDAAIRERLRSVAQIASEETRWPPEFREELKSIAEEK